ncbi:cell division ATP-binding protein FtsE [Roseisolibacter agri]|uniref:Cell division ATP-binding protein FtsE n=1 Tax=Roseisolibacter agri TaxID=2014610 RepID=A0AA37V2N9_9BACT|nr:cell division ATP-binding protein FtsE [Roseisolibacter agri]GLC28120.1 cell division ATP-binding protein FtsE [Roseisolibacter agri]
MLRYLNVVKEYPRSGTALHGVSFHLAKGEFAFLTGPSGSGKSSLLKLAYLEERPTKGEVRVAGQSASSARSRDVAMLRRKLGVVFQDFRLLPDRSAEANVAFALEVTGAPQGAIRDRVARALAQVGLAAKGTSLPHELSGGEQQRVAIARALVNRPLLLLADEPTGNLDDRAARGVYQLLREINAGGTAVLMATHNSELVKRADLRVLELHRGRLVFDSAEGGASTPAADAVAAALDEVRRRETPPHGGLP